MHRPFVVCSALVAVACGGQSLSSPGRSGSPSGTNGSSSGTTSPPISFGAPTSIAEHVPSPPTILASDGATLFWIDGDDFLWSVPVGGGTPTQLACSAAAFLYLDSTSVYFETDGGFASVPKKGGATSTLITASPSAATVTAGTVYWIEEDRSASSSQPQSLVKSAPLVAGSAVTTMGTFASLEAPSAIAASGSTLFLSGAGAPEAIPAEGSSLATFDVGTCFALVASSDGVYCGDGSVTLVALDGKGTTRIAAEANDVASIALDATNVYWVNKAASGSIVMAPRRGGANVTVAYDVNPYAVAVDDGAVYWSDAGGSVQRVEKR